MRLVLVHGRAQGRKTEQQLRGEWLPALRRGIEAAGLPPLAETLDVRVPFYGAELDRLVAAPPAEYVERGAGGEPDALQAELLAALADRAGITDAQIEAELTDPYAEKGPQNWGWVQAIGRALTRHTPWLTDAALSRFVRDVDAYLTRVDVSKAVDELVAAAIEGDDAVVVGHSLGSVVTYNVLSQLGDRAKVPLYVTVGAPLGIPAIKKRIARPLGMPRGVARWLNGTDERDFVALYARLDRDTFPAEIENVSDLHNPHDDPHGIAGYLSDRVIARRIAEALA